MTERTFADTMAAPADGFDAMAPENVSPLVVWLGSAGERRCHRAGSSRPRAAGSRSWRAGGPARPPTRAPVDPRRGGGDGAEAAGGGGGAAAGLRRSVTPGLARTAAGRRPVRHKQGALPFARPRHDGPSVDVRGVAAVDRTTLRVPPWPAHREHPESAEEGQNGGAAQDGLDGGAVGPAAVVGEPLTASSTVVAIIHSSAHRTAPATSTPAPTPRPVRSAGTCACVATFVSAHPSPMPTPQTAKTTAYQPRGCTQVSASSPAPLVSMPQAISRLGTPPQRPAGRPSSWPRRPPQDSARKITPAWNGDRPRACCR